jgi:hypothetical protein
MKEAKMYNFLKTFHFPGRSKVAYVYILFCAIIKEADMRLSLAVLMC